MKKYPPYITYQLWVISSIVSLLLLLAKQCSSPGKQFFWCSQSMTLNPFFLLRINTTLILEKKVKLNVLLCWFAFAFRAKMRSGVTRNWCLRKYLCRPVLDLNWEMHRYLCQLKCTAFVGLNNLVRKTRNQRNHMKYWRRPCNTRLRVLHPFALKYRFYARKIIKHAFSMFYTVIKYRFLTNQSACRVPSI